MNATSDSMSAINVAMGNHGLSAWHPLIWSLSVIPFVWLGNALGDPNIGLGICTLLQSALCAGIYAFVCAWIKHRNAPRALYWLSIAFFALNPVIAQYAIYVSKDGLFASFFTLYAILLFDVAFTKGAILKNNRFLALFAIATFLIASFRMNAMYAAIAIIIVLAIVFRKTLLKRVLPLLLIPIAVWTLYGPVCESLGIARSPFSESAAVPLSQIGYVLHNDGDIPDEAAQTLEKILPLDEWGDAYRRDTMNDIKFHEHFDGSFLERHKTEFLAAWFQVGMENPVAYLTAWLAMTEGFWNIDSHPDWVAPSSYYHYVNPAGYTPSTELQPSDGLIYPATGIGLLDHNTGGDIRILKDSILFYPLCNIAIMVWFTAFALGFIATSRTKRTLWALPLFALFIVYATVLAATPVWCEFRYVYAFHLMIPVTACVLLLKAHNESDADDGTAKGNKDER